MDIGPVTTRLVPSDVGRLTPVAAAAQPVRTEVPTRLAVQQVPGDAAATPAGQESAAPPDVAPTKERQLSIDPDTRAVVSRVYDQATGDLLSQVPDQALLRLKVYAREVVADLDERNGRGQRVHRIV